eukprot:scaffold114051_cov17-Prasinocladus_malaysianus.AAC.1
MNAYLSHRRGFHCSVRDKSNDFGDVMSICKLSVALALALETIESRKLIRSICALNDVRSLLTCNGGLVQQCTKIFRGNFKDCRLAELP